MVIYGKRYDGVNEEPKYDNVKTPLCQERREIWVKVKESRNRPVVVQKVPGVLGSQIS